MRKFGSSSIWKLKNLKVQEFKNSSHSVGLDLSNEMYSIEIDASVSNSSGLTYNKQGIIAFEMEAKKRYFRWSYSLCTFGYRDIAAYRVSCEMVAEGKTARRHLQTSKEICLECFYLNVFVVCLEFVSYSFRGFLFSFLSEVMSFFLLTNLNIPKTCSYFTFLPDIQNILFWHFKLTTYSFRVLILLS